MKKLVERDVRYSFEARMQKLEGEKQRIRNCKAITEQEYLEKYARYTAGTSSRETFQEFRRAYLEKMDSYQEQLEELDAEGKKVKRNMTACYMYRTYIPCAAPPARPHDDSPPGVSCWLHISRRIAFPGKYSLQTLWILSSHPNLPSGKSLRA